MFLLTIKGFHGKLYPYSEGKNMEKYSGIQAALDKFVLEGGKVDDLDKNHPLYRRVNKAIILNDKGERLTMEEKFAYFNHARTPKKQMGALDRIKKALDALVASKRKVEDLTIEDPEYKMVKDANIKGPDGKRMTVSEIFAAVGHPRPEKRTSDIKKKLVEKIEAHLKTGKTFHMKRKSLPFYEDLRTYCRSVGGNLTPEQAMHGLGYREYSDLYYRFGELERMHDFRDENGFVDGYRKDSKFNQYVKSVAETLNMPIPIVIALICNEKTETTFLQKDYLDITEKKLQEHIETHRTLEGISKSNPELYSYLRYLKEYVFTDLGDQVQIDDLLFILGAPDVKHNLDTVEKDPTILSSTMEILMDRAEGNGGVLSRKEMLPTEYYAVLDAAVRSGVTVEAYLKSYDIDYKGGRNVPRLNRMKVDEIPMLDVMKERRDELMQMSGVSLENGNCKEEVFEKYLEACMQAYSEYAIHYDKTYDSSKIELPTGGRHLRRG